MVRKVVRRRDLVLLWARAAGMCSHPDCRRRLVLDAPASDRAAIIGEAAHIVAQSAAGPRGGMPTGDLDRYPNLILLCSNHHAMIDDLPEIYAVDTLRTWKAEHEAWVEAVTAGAPGRAPWTVILHEDRPWIQRTEAIAALGANAAVRGLHEFRADVDLNGWSIAAPREFRQVTTALADTPPDRRRFAVFSLARIPLAVQSGYVLGDRARVDLFHFDRDRGAWSWDDTLPDPDPSVTWTAQDCPEGPRDEAAVRISLSAPIHPEPALRAGFEIDIRVPAPSVRWLRARTQLAELSRIYEQALAAIRARASRRIHLYYAGPAPGAIAFGRAYNPRMNPPLVVYEYHRDRSPSYEPALVLNR